MKLHLGSGPHVKQGWLNYDIGVFPGVHRLDLSMGNIPHAIASVSFVFSEHFIEHLTREQGAELMRECRRVLRPGGVMRISCPDLAHVCRSYVDKNLVQIKGCWEPSTLCQMVNESMRLWEHKYLYDFDEIRLLLREAGFKNVVRVGHRESVHPELRDLEVRPFLEDLIVEATK